MKYFIYCLFFSAPILSYFCWRVFQNKIKVLLIKSLIQKAALQKIDRHHLCLFKDILFEMAAKVVAKASKKKQTEIIKSLQKNELNALFEYLSLKEQPLSHALQKIMEYPTKAFRQQNFKGSYISKLALALIHESCFDYPPIQNDLKNFPYFCKSKLKTIKNLCNARHSFLKADFKKASKTLLKTSKVFQRKKCFDELAYTYFMLSQMYHIFGAFDAAEMMLTSAMHLYKKTQNTYGQNFILGELGINCLAQNRIEEADSYFRQAATSHKKNKDTLHLAEILNQQARLENLASNPKKALKHATSALKKHQLLKNKAGVALSCEQIALAHYEIGNPKKATAFALIAKKNYMAQKNNDAYADSLAFLAKVQLEAGHIENAKKYFNALKYHLKKYQTTFLPENLEKLKRDFNIKTRR
ncbi:MAG: hypothetical protein IJ870_03445 [Alphaproteobacteria bacterium]|nr:hypothetical protein [Alphaproteobacteria bacterium]